MRYLISRFWLCSLWLCGLSAGAQTPVPLQGISGSVSAMAEDADYVYVGGRFGQAGQLGEGITRVNTTTGAVLPHGLNVTGTVHSIVEDPNGGLYIGGLFSMVNGVSRNSVARLRPDLTVDPNWNPNVNATVLSMALDGGFLYVGGTFNAIGTRTHNRIGRIHVSTAQSDTTWTPSANSQINALAVHHDGVFIGGLFSQVNGQSLAGLAKLNKANGAPDPAWRPSVTLSVTGWGISCLWVSGTRLFFGGEFTQINGQPRANIACLHTGDATLDPWNPGANDKVTAMTLSGDHLYVTGKFFELQHANGGATVQTRLGRISVTNGLVDATWLPQLFGGVELYALLVDGASLFVTGEFELAHTNIVLPGNAKVSLTTGNVDPDWNPGIGTWVRVMRKIGNEIWMGGDFAMSGQVPATNVCRFFKSTGLLDQNWRPALPSSGFVYALAVQGDSVYVGGQLGTVGGIPGTENLVRFDRNTGALHNWITHVSGPVRSIVLHGPHVYIGGQFEWVGGMPNAGTAKIHKITAASDAAWSTLVTNSPNSVNTIAIADGHLYVGGSFGMYAGQHQPYLAKINLSNTQAVTTWRPVLDGAVLTLTPHNGLLYVGGTFSNANGLARTRVARLSQADGSTDANWNADIQQFGSGQRVLSVAVRGDYVYVGGVFNRIGGVIRAGFGRVSVQNGAVDGNWGDASTNNAVTVSAVIASSDVIYAAGTFRQLYPQLLGTVRMANMAALRTPSVWNGTQWDEGTPTLGRDAVIAANYPETGPSFEAERIVVTAGTLLNIGPGKTVRFRRNLVSSSGVRANITGEGTLHFAGSVPQQVSAVAIQNLAHWIMDNPAGVFFPLGILQSVNKTFTIRPGALIHVNTGANSVLQLNSTSDSTTAVIIGGTEASIVGNIRARRFLRRVSSAGYGTNGNYKYISSPIAITLSGANILNLAPTATNLLRFNESAGNGGAGWQPVPNNELLNGQGYLHWITEDKTLLFFGPPQMTDKTVPLSYSGAVPQDNTFGWNLIGNPFPSVLDLAAVTFQQTDPTVYVFNFATDSYWNWNLSTATGAGIGNSRYLDMGQAFFVKAGGAGASVHFPAAARVAAPVRHFRPNREEYQRYETKLTLTAPDGRQYETMVRFFDEAGADFDGLYDAYYLPGHQVTTPRFYSKTAQQSYSINSLPTAHLAGGIVPVVLTGMAGSYRLRVALGSGFGPEQRIILEDRLTGQSTDLTTYRGEYVFRTEEGVNPERFLLHFRQADSSAEGIAAQWYAYAAEGMIGVSFLDSSLEGAAEVLDMTGKPISPLVSFEHGHGIRFDMKQAASGIYLVRLQTAKGSQIRKVVVE